MPQQHIGLDFRTAALDLAGVSRDLGLKDPTQSDTINTALPKTGFGM
jgi:hypothetical protein